MARRVPPCRWQRVAVCVAELTAPLPLRLLQVKLVVDKRDGREYAMKIIPRPTKDVERQMKVRLRAPLPTHASRASRAAAAQVIRSEIEALERVKRFGGHENIIALHEVFENAEAVFIVMELATGGELMEAIAEKKVRACVRACICRSC